jgi:alkylation response protein AidB-like acyl-CoA dehydrogenase
VPIAITEEQRAIQRSISDIAGRTDLVATVRALETGTGLWRRHWAELASIGLFSIALPEELGGAGCGLDDQCAALEQAAHALVPGPVLPTVLAGILLARQPDSPAAKELLPRIADGTATVGVGLGGDVLGADRDAHLILPVGDEWFVVPPGHPDLEVSEVDRADFSVPAAGVRLARPPEECRLPGLSLEVVTELAAILAAAEAAGVARWCVRTASGHAGTREQFGRPIGSFQAVKHLCAEMLCRAELAAAVAWDAARDQDRLAVAVAAAVGLDAAVDNAKDCVQVLGGIGFTWEHDAHLYLRRAVATRRWLGGTDRFRQRAAELALGGVRRTLTLEPSGAEPSDAVRELATLSEADQRKWLAESGYLMPHWPKPYGLDADPRTQLAIDAELALAGVRRPDLVIGAWAAPTIISHGTDEQRDRFVGPTLRGEIQWCQLFSEPEAGSDLASLRTKAIRADGGWLLSGQKVWTSRALQADWGICLARTDPAAPKHRGITYFLVDMRAPGIDIRPLREITGDARFNEVFLDDVFVPDDLVVGEVNDGWRLARTTLANERVAMSVGSSLGESLERLLARVGAADPVVRQRIGALVAQGHAVSVVDFRATLRRLAGQDPGAESSVRKLVGVRHRQDVAELGYELIGEDLLNEFLVTRCLSIAGGTTQVLLNVIGERILGLPRS